jgi:hypothetical protein
MVVLILAAGVLTEALTIMAVLIWVRLGNLGDLLALLLWRRAGKTPPQISQYQGFF